MNGVNKDSPITENGLALQRDVIGRRRRGNLKPARGGVKGCGCLRVKYPSSTELQILNLTHRRIDIDIAQLNLR
jgi:hypothetical protein